MRSLANVFRLIMCSIQCWRSWQCSDASLRVEIEKWIFSKDLSWYRIAKSSGLALTLIQEVFSTRSVNTTFPRLTTYSNPPLTQMPDSQGTSMFLIDTIANNKKACTLKIKYHNLSLKARIFRFVRQYIETMAKIATFIAANNMWRGYY